MAAGKCAAAYHTDEWHGYGCDITGGACMFLYPDSKACAEQYGEGPDSIRTEIPEKWLEWQQAETGERLYCPMLEIVVDTYIRGESSLLYTAPFQAESGGLFCYKFDLEEVCWQEDAVPVGDAEVKSGFRECINIHYENLMRYLSE